MKYFPYDANKTLLNALICTELQEYLLSDIKTVLNEPPKYFCFIQSELPKLIFFENIIFHNYKTTDDISKTLTPNMSKIQLGPCESLLKYHYNICLQDPLIIYVIDKLPLSNVISNEVKYYVFSLNGVLLDTSICESTTGTQITVLISINSVNKDKYEEAKYLASLGIDVFNSEDPFFNDICFPFTTEKKQIFLERIEYQSIFKTIAHYAQVIVYLLTLTSTLQKPIGNCPKPKEQKNDLSFEGIKDNLLGALLDANFEVVLCYKLAFDINII